MTKRLVQLPSISFASTTRRARLDQCLEEITRGVGPSWHKYRLIGATRDGLAPAKEGVGKNPERYKPVEPGTIFYNPMRILLGSIAFVDEDENPGITSPDYVVFKGKPGVLHPRWFYYWLRSDYGAAFIRTLTRGAVRERMLFRRLVTAEIELPSYDAQLSFAQQIPAVERARAAAEARLEAAKALPAAYLQEVFNSSEVRKWPQKCIGELARVQSGYAFKSEWFLTEGIRLLRNTNVFQGYINWDDVVFLSVDRQSEFRDYELFAGDLILSLDRPLVSNGLKVARLSQKDIPALLLQRVGRFQIYGSLDPDYLYAFLNSTKFIRAITGHDQSLGVPHISPKQVEAVPIPFPPLIEQQYLAAQLNEHRTESERLCRKLEEQLAIIKTLPAVFLRQAFNGEL